MKKLTLLAITLLGMGSINAQNKMALSSGSILNAKGKSIPASALTNHHSAGKNVNPSTLTTIFSEDFASGLPATWTQVDSAGNGEVWTYTTTGPVGYPTYALASTTAANGWMIFDDDNYGNTVPSFASASLTTPAFNCSANAQVFLSLQEEFRQYLLGEGVIYVSNDSVTWTAVHNAADGLIQDASTLNPYAPVIDISAVAANQATVYLKFTYRGDWDYFWQIDDIEVYEPVATDVSALNVNPLSTEYTQVPQLQLSNVILSGDVKNVGAAATTGGTALFEVVDTLTNAVAFSQTVNLPTIASLATTSVSTTNPFNPSTSGAYKVRLTVALAGDVNPLNDIMESASTTISDSVYARDNDVNTGSLGIGVGPADGIIGQNFTINTAAQVTSVSFFLTDLMDPNPSGSPIWATIHTQTPGAEPNSTSMSSTDTVMIMPGSIATGGQWFTLPISTFSVNLTPGLYYIGIHEADSLLTLGRCAAIATPNTVWVSWNSIPSPPAVNGWASAGDFGFNIAYQLRLNFGDVTAGISTITSLSGFDIYPNPSNGIINVSNGNNDGAGYTVSVFNTIGQTVYASKSTTAALTTIDLSTQPAGVYHVKVSNNSGSFDKSIVISNK